MTNEDLYIQRDRLRYIKNTTSANLALLAILLDVFFFVNIYKSDVGTYYYTILIGASVVYNLLFMLATFLCEEGVKNYKKNYSYALIVLGILQIVRIFIIPSRAHAATTIIGGAEVAVMGNGQYIRLLVYLVVSAACLIASAMINLKKCGELEEHMKTLDKKIS